MGTVLRIVSPLPSWLHIEKDKNEGDEIVVNIDVNVEVKNDENSGFLKMYFKSRISLEKTYFLTTFKRVESSKLLSIHFLAFHSTASW